MFWSFSTPSTCFTRTAALLFSTPTLQHISINLLFRIRFAQSFPPVRSSCHRSGEYVQPVISTGAITFSGFPPPATCFFNAFKKTSNRFSKYQGYGRGGASIFIRAAKQTNSTHWSRIIRWDSQRPPHWNSTRVHSPWCFYGTSVGLPCVQELDHKYPTREKRVRLID